MKLMRKNEKLRICVTMHMAVKNDDLKMNKNVQRLQNSKTKTCAERLKNLMQSVTTVNIVTTK